MIYGIYFSTGIQVVMFKLLFITTPQIIDHASAVELTVVSPLTTSVVIDSHVEVVHASVFAITDEPVEVITITDKPSTSAPSIVESTLVAAVLVSADPGVSEDVVLPTHSVVLPISAAILIPQHVDHISVAPDTTVHDSSHSILTTKPILIQHVDQVSVAPDTTVHDQIHSKLTKPILRRRAHEMTPSPNDHETRVHHDHIHIKHDEHWVRKDGNANLVGMHYYTPMLFKRGNNLFIIFMFYQTQYWFLVAPRNPPQMKKFCQSSCILIIHIYRQQT